MKSAAGTPLSATSAMKTPRRSFGSSKTSKKSPPTWRAVRQRAEISQALGPGKVSGMKVRWIWRASCTSVSRRSRARISLSKRSFWMARAACWATPLRISIRRLRKRRPPMASSTSSTPVDIVLDEQREGHQQPVVGGHDRRRGPPQAGRDLRPVLRVEIALGADHRSAGSRRRPAATENFRGRARSTGRPALRPAGRTPGREEASRCWAPSGRSAPVPRPPGWAGCARSSPGSHPGPRGWQRPAATCNKAAEA